MNLIRVEKLSISTLRCECLVSENTHIIHARQGRQNPAHCQSMAKCVVGVKPMCHRHAQYEVFHMLLRGTHLLVEKE